MLPSSLLFSLTHSLALSHSLKNENYKAEEQVKGKKRYEMKE